MKTTIAIVDDHDLVAQAFSGLIQRYEEYEVIYEVGNGKELINLKMIPDIVLLDIVMPEMDGYENIAQNPQSLDGAGPPVRM
jgi:two-component system, NarL family, invasion response regulator UvrY